MIRRIRSALAVKRARCTGCLVATLLAACASSGVERVAPPGITAAYVFLVSLDTSGAPLSVSGSFRVEDGALVSPESVLLPGVGAQRVAMVALEREMLAELQGGLDRVPIEEVGLTPESPPMTTDDLPRTQEGLVRARLPGRARWWELDRATGRFEPLIDGPNDRLTLWLRTAADSAPTLVPLTDRAWLALPSPETQMVSSFAWLDEVRGVFACDGGAPCGVGLVVKGRSFEPDPYDPQRPGNWVPFEALAPAQAAKVINRLLVLPVQSATVAEILLVGWMLLGTERSGGVWRLRASGEGLAVAPSPRIAWPPALGPLPGLNDAAVSDDGAIVIVGEAATILTGHAPGLSSLEPRSGVLQRFGRLINGPADTADFTRVIQRRDAPTTVIGTDFGQVIEGDAERDAWDQLADVGAWLRVIESPRVLGLVATDDPPELWVSGPTGGLVRRGADAAWRAVTLHLAPSMGACAAQDADTGALHLTQNFTGLATSGEHLYVSIFDCAALLQLRRGDLAATTVTLPGEDVRRLDASQRPIFVDGRPPVIFGGRFRLSMIAPE